MNTTLKDAEVEVNCSECNGSGRCCIEDDGRCALCDGTGLMLTDLGEKIVALMRRRFRVCEVDG